MKVVEATSQGTNERVILTAMITNDEVCGKIASRWEEGGLFEGDDSNIAGEWCVTFFREYGKAPRRQIESLFASWVDDHSGQKELVRKIEKYLGDLSGQYVRTGKKVNAQFVLDLAGKHFNKVRLRRAAEGVLADLEVGKAKNAWSRWNKTKPVEVGVGEAVDVFQSTSSMKSAFLSRKNSVLVKYPGALGNFFGDSLSRDGFIAFLAPEKRGKTFWLMDLCWRAALQRKRVAFFQVGDLSKDQCLRRFGTRAAGRPIRPTRPGQVVKIPVELKQSGDEVLVVHKDKVYEKELTWKKVVQCMKKVQEERIKSDQSYLRLSVHPNSSLTVDGSREILRGWEIHDKWIPDVVVYDYADILAPPAGFRGESRDAVNENWKAMRRLSQDYHNLVVTATQANAASYTSSSLGMENFSEDKRKFSHVTGMISLNQTEGEKAEQLMRLGWLVLREDEFLTSHQVKVAGCLAIANPAILSI